MQSTTSMNYFAAQTARHLAAQRLEWRLHEAYLEHTMSNTYGIIDHAGTFHRTGGTLRGAKTSASRHHLNVVATRSPLGYNIDIVARKVGGKWVTS